MGLKLRTEGRSTVPVLLFFALVMVVYIPLVLRGGFTVDDWGTVERAQAQPHFWDNVSSWFPQNSNRPVVGLLLATVGLLFRDVPWLYFAADLALWFGALALMMKVIGRYLSPSARMIFLVFAAFPTAATAVIFSAAMLIGSPLSIALWAFSFYLLDRSIDESSTWRYWASWGLILTAFLEYEIILPFMVLHAALPFLKGRRLDFGYFKHFVLPILGILLFIAVFQKLIMPRYAVVYSRLVYHGARPAIHAMTHFFTCIFRDLPRLLFRSVVHFITHSSASLWEIAAIISLLTGIALSADEKESTAGNALLLPLAVVTLAACSSLFLLTSQNATVEGYLNRGLASAWICLALVVAAGFDRLAPSRAKSAAFTALAGLVILSFVIQRNQLIETWKLQLKIVEQVFEKVDEKKAGSGLTVLGDVPAFLPDNFSNQLIFGYPWDFGNALKILSHKRILGGAVVYSPGDRVLRADVKANEIIMDNWWKAGYDSLWFYKYSQDPKQAIFEPIRDEKDSAAAAEVGVIEEREE